MILDVKTTVLSSDFSGVETFTLKGILVLQKIVPNYEEPKVIGPPPPKEDKITYKHKKFGNETFRVKILPIDTGDNEQAKLDMNKVLKKGWLGEI